MRQFAIIGLGRFGQYLARHLAEAGFEVLAMDLSEQQVDRVRLHVSKAVIADATDKDALSALGVQDMDVVVVALARDMAASILATLNLKELGAKEIMARAYSEEHRRILELIGANTVLFLERDMAQRIAYNLSVHNVLEQVPVADGYSIIHFAPPPSFVGRTLEDLALTRRFGSLVIAVKESIPENFIATPGKDFRIKDSDILIVMGKDNDLQKLQDVR